jgi:C-terminal processing protease CtpA/Prc
MIIERVSGKSYGQFIADRIFGPAGMTDTRFTHPEEIAPRRSGGYMDHDGRLENGGSGIIIDLRGNGDDDDAVALKLADQLFDKKTLLMVSRKRNGDDRSYEARPQKNPYLGPVVILVNEITGSASEPSAAGLQQNGRAYIIDKRTKGAIMARSQWHIQNVSMPK